ncbi:MAG: hypothetical protein FWD34_07040 [Oscillospiraceae bacterium]|nr:hypothetical protein [Oscillospiraceae bacterium]
MRRIVLIILTILVAGIVTFFCLREFAIPEIAYVTDYTKQAGDNQFTVWRLYAAQVDEAAFAEELEGIINMTEYDEEEILKAAIASGNPEFYPAFSMNVYNAGTEIYLGGYIEVKLAEKQEELRFKFGEISLEAITRELIIEDIEIIPYAGSENEQLVKIMSPQKMAVDLTNAAAYTIKLNGTSGTVILQYKFTIEADTFLPKTVLTEQILRVHANITLGDDGNLTVEFINEPYSDLEDLGA